jgi:hypothetical protein
MTKENANRNAAKLKEVSAKDGRAARLAAQLRANLRRRKDQARMIDTASISAQDTD